MVSTLHLDGWRLWSRFRRVPKYARLARLCGRGPGLVVGTTIGEVDIPPFSQIKGVLRLPPEPAGMGLGATLVQVENLWQQSPILEAGFKKTVVDCDISLVDGIGTEYYFIEPGDITPLMKWYDDRQDIFARVELTADVFEVYVPWLAVVFVRGNFAT